MFILPLEGRTRRLAASGQREVSRLLRFRAVTKQLLGSDQALMPSREPGRHQRKPVRIRCLISSQSRFELATQAFGFYAIHGQNVSEDLQALGIFRPSLHYHSLEVSRGGLDVVAS